MPAEQQPPRVWLVLTLGDDRQYAGNAGYIDDPGKWYSYDSFVANHRRVAAGDFAIICHRVRALGIAKIEKIDSEPSTRLLQRCPVCSETGIKKRTTKTPQYRCNNRHEFEEPIGENAACTKFVAFFGESFVPFHEHFGRDFLRPGCPRYSDQLAMQEFEFARMEDSFSKRFPDTAALIATLSTRLYVLPEAADVSRRHPQDTYTPGNEDNRELLLRQICARRGQQEFRDKLRARYGDKCMISGCEVLHVVEAAHIKPYRGLADNHEENGLLLRSDLHILFDLDLIGVDPVKLTVHVSPELYGSDYLSFQGMQLRSGTKRPSEAALQIRWSAFRARVRLCQTGAEPEAVILAAREATAAEGASSS